MKTKKVQIGKIVIGGGMPIAVQSMTNTDTRQVTTTVAQIRRLVITGCEIVRVAIPDPDAAAAFAKIRERVSSVPLVADIHFDYRLAIAAARAGADKIRINPGNLGSQDNLKKVVEICREKKIPIRIGVNAGSLEKIPGKSITARLVASVVRNVRTLEKLNFKNIVVSAKSSSVPVSVAAYRKLSRVLPYPLHLGVTEAGSKHAGIVKSAAGIGALLCDGIGDTLRISLTAKPEVEIQAAWDLLRACEIRQKGVNIISCPTCGRTEVDLIPLVAKVEKALSKVKKSLTVAVMGCAVNGPGEARHADFALVGGKRMFGIYRAGKFEKSVSEEKALVEFLKLINSSHDF